MFFEKLNKKDTNENNYFMSISTKKYKKGIKWILISHLIPFYSIY